MATNRSIVLSQGDQGFSEDLRRRIVEAVEGGKHPDEVASVFSVSLASVKRFVKQRREQGHLRLKSPPGRPRTLSNADESLLAEQVKAYKDASLQEHTELLNKTTGHRVSFTTVQRALVRLGITRKKDASAERAR